MKKIWRDFSILRWINIASALLLLFLTIGLVRFKIDIIDYILAIPIGVIAVYILCYAILTKLTYVVISGIRIGNSTVFSLHDIKNKPIFIQWKQIEYITIIGREIKSGWVIHLINFLVIKTKNGKKFECYIARPKSFVSVIKDIKKDYLFKKDSKYLYHIPRYG